MLFTCLVAIGIQMAITVCTDIIGLISAGKNISSHLFVFSRVLNSTMFESWAIVGPYPSWWLFNFLLLVLQVLHIIWSYLIARIAVKAMLRGKVSHRTDLGGY